MSFSRDQFPESFTKAVAINKKVWNVKADTVQETVSLLKDSISSSLFNIKTVIDMIIFIYQKRSENIESYLTLLLEIIKVFDINNIQSYFTLQTPLKSILVRRKILSGKEAPANANKTEEVLIANAKKAAVKPTLTNLEKCIEFNWKEGINSFKSKNNFNYSWVNCVFNIDAFLEKLCHIDDVNKSDNQSWSPLSIACKGGYTFIIEFLLKNGADVYINYHLTAY
ncbi:hypothetical protein TVAG_168780 [Trichomonas vaginalis G3]|uniref:Uncharacterized protein n=1 Tax=Trichomonas vaginalis (strain ATCC PRA-98 / G3) TaxID=412133 RepID=A2FHF2_TRIV3|nr:Ankyrin repeat family [Trichomonas vaginalis G3]EAX95669.1 hypothetical protein TVAG_168780 [Trichomonas vaginalis G3]KAI5538171.1 Ankyrin repeat family [Trichomonas vaginalis G3]|eukprot:XP_001308599.1 hypothetical protein [Trichomonas vaginalis G3]